MSRVTELPPSLGRRLALLLLVPAAVILIAGTVIDYLATIAPVRRTYDQALIDDAIAIAGYIRVDRGGHVIVALPPAAVAILRTNRKDSVFFRVTAADGSFIAGDADLPRPPAAMGNPSLHDLTYRGKPIRAAFYRAKTPAGMANVVVAETMDKRAALQMKLLSIETGIDIMELTAIITLGWLGMRIALRPLHALSMQIANRSARDLEPVDAGSVPIEVHPLVAALNRLLLSVSDSSRAQREFLENAAHQLRTPLTGIQAQLQLLMAEPAAGAVRARLAPLLDATQRLGRTTHQLLALARSGESANLQDSFSTVDLASVVAFMVDSHLSQAVEAGVELAADAGVAEVEGIRWLLEELLGNLIDNAIQHTPAGGTVTVRCGAVAGAGFIEVVDTGCGIPPEDRERVIARFARGRDETRHGSGLGLAIVSAIASLHGAELGIAAGPGGRGTSVRIDFPRQSP